MNEILSLIPDVHRAVSASDNSMLKVRDIGSEQIITSFSDDLK